MNIEIANRLVNLRKSNNLSQEALAEKIGISRQAVSKWERAEASPDTDNLILLARLYGMSLDELLKTDEEVTVENVTPEIENIPNENNPDENETERMNEEYVHVGFGGVHVKDKDGSEVHVGWDGIHVDDKKSDNVHIDKKGVYVNGEKYDKEWFHYHNGFPTTLIVCVIYIMIGIFFNAWHPGWLLFLMIPIWHSLVEAIIKKNAHCFAYPVLMTVVFLCAGFFLGAWHPAWVLFVTIPVYYSLVSYFHYIRRNNMKEYQNAADEFSDYNRE